MIHNISMFLLLEDKKDLGRGIYYNRTDYYYHNKYSPDHPGFFHHWMIGLVGLMFAQVGSLFVKGKDMYETFKRIESGDLSGIDESLIDSLEDNTITLEDYKGEVEGIKNITPKPSLIYKPQDKKLMIKANLPI